MKSVNSDYLRFIEENNFLDYAYRIELQRPDGKAYTYEGDVIQSFEINGTESSSGFSIGETLSLQLKLTLLLEERQGEKDIPTNSKLIPYIIYKWTEKVDDEVVNHEEETCMGIFYVNDVKADHRHKVSITAVDAMSATELLGGVYDDPNIKVFPIGDMKIADDIASKFKDDIIFDLGDDYGLDVQSLTFNEYIYGKSYREVLGYIAAANAGFARVVPEWVTIDEETGEKELRSRLEFTSYNDTGIVLRIKDDNGEPNLFSKIKTIKSGANKFNLERIATTVYVRNADVKLTDDSGDANKSAYATATIAYPVDSSAKPYEVIEFDCPFAASQFCTLSNGFVKLDSVTEQNMKKIFDKIQDVSYYPIDATLFGYHFLECGDIVKIENTYGEILDLYIQDIKISVAGGVTVTVSSKYDYTKTNTLKNSITARVDSLTQELHSFANNFEISKNKIEMSVSKSEAETIIQESLADLNMGVNQWIREVYNLDGVKDIDTPKSLQLQGRKPLITDIIPDPVDGKFPALDEFIGTEEENAPGVDTLFGIRTVRYATCVKVAERTTIGIMVRQNGDPNVISHNNVTVYLNTEEKDSPNGEDGKPISLKKIELIKHIVNEETGETTTETEEEVIGTDTEHNGYYTYNAVLNAGWNIIEILHYERLGDYLDIKCGRVDIGDINVIEDIQNVNELYEVDVFHRSPFIGLVNCNALSITYTRFVGAEFTIESDAIKQVVTEITDATKKIGELTTRYDSISARVEETRIDIEDLDTKYTEIKNTADEITLTANQTKETVEEIETKMNGTMEVVTRLEEESQLAVKKDEISTYVQEEISYTMGEIEQNYVQKSEMEQNNAEIKMSFSQSGGYNLIQESAFYNDEAFGQDGIWKLISNNSGLSYMRYTYEDKLGYPDPNANTLFFPKLSSHDKENTQSYNPYMEQDLDLVPGKTYTFSMQFASPDGENSWAKSEGKMDFRLSYNGSTIHSTNLWTSATEESINNGEEGNRMTEGGKTDDGWIKCKTQFHIPKSYGLQKDTNEDGVIDDSDIQPLTFTLRVSFTKTPFESRLLIVHPLLVEGELDMVYSPNPNEMYTGVTRINKDGIKISRSDSTLATTIDHKGMTITTDQSVAAEFRSDYAYVPVARIDKVINSNIPSKGSRTNVLIVNKTKYEQAPDENTFRTLQECFDSIPDITTSEITIEVQEHTNGGYLRDKSGSPIEIVLWEGAQIGSTVIFSNVNNSISIHSENQSFSQSNYPYGYVRGIACANCHNVVISYLHLDELTYADTNNLNDLGIGINAYRNVSTAVILEGSTATVKYCNVLSNVNYDKEGIDISCIVAARNSRCITYNCRGNTSSRTNVKYVYLSLGYSFLYIARHTDLLLETDSNINIDNVVNVLPEGIKLIKFPNNEANLTTFTNREYEADSSYFDRYPEAGITNPSYGKIKENVKIYSSSRQQQTRYYNNSNGKYIISSKINGGSLVGTSRRNNRYYYDRTIFEFDPEKFKSALFGAQTKVYDDNGNPLDGETTLEAKLIIEAESIDDYVNRTGYPSSRYVPVNILMYSDLNYAYDDSVRDSADPKFGEGIDGKYDYVPNNVLSSNTVYLFDNDEYWTYDNHGFYSENMTIEIPIKFNMVSLNNELSSTYRNGTEDMKNGKVRYVIVETGIYAQDDEGNLIEGETASVKLKDVHFNLSYDINGSYVPGGGGSVIPPGEGGSGGGEEVTYLTVPNYYSNTDPADSYKSWCSKNGITYETAEIAHISIAKGKFVKCSPEPGSTIYKDEVLTIYISKGQEPTYTGARSLSDSMNFPVWQGRLYSNGTWDVDTIEYDTEYDNFGSTVIGYPDYYANQYMGINYMRYCRKIFRFVPQDFVNILENATSISNACIVIDGTESYYVEDASSIYYNEYPFKVGIYNDLSEIADNPSDISSSINVNGNQVLSVDSNVQTLNKLKSDMGRQVKLTITNISEFKSGILKYVVVDAHGFNCEHSYFDIDSSSDKEGIYIEVKYTENGYSKTARLYPVRDYTRPIMIPNIEKSTTQEIRLTGNTPALRSELPDTTAYESFYLPDDLLHYYNDSNYTLVSEYEGNRIGVSGTSLQETFHRTIFEFDPTDFKKVLPSSFVTDRRNIYVNVEGTLESIDHSAYFAHGIYNSKTDMNNNLTLLKHKRNIVNDSSGIEIEATNYEGVQRFDKYLYTGLYIYSYSDRSRQYILDGKMKYVSIFPYWDVTDYYGHYDYMFEMYVKSVYLLYYGVSAPVTSSVSLLTIEDDYLEE